MTMMSPTKGERDCWSTLETLSFNIPPSLIEAYQWSPLIQEKPV